MGWLSTIFRRELTIECHQLREYVVCKSPPFSDSKFGMDYFWFQLRFLITPVISRFLICKSTFNQATPCFCLFQKGGLLQDSTKPFGSLSISCKNFTHVNLTDNCTPPPIVSVQCYILPWNWCTLKKGILKFVPRLLRNGEKINQASWATS